MSESEEYKTGDDSEMDELMAKVKEEVELMHRPRRNITDKEK